MGLEDEVCSWRRGEGRTEAVPRGRVEGGWGLFIFAGGDRPEGAQSVKIIRYTRAQNNPARQQVPSQPLPSLLALSSQINFRGPVSQLFFPRSFLLFPSFPLSGFQLRCSLKLASLGSPVLGPCTLEVPRPGPAHPCSLPLCSLFPEISQNRLPSMYTHFTRSPCKLPCILRLR